MKTTRQVSDSKLTLPVIVIIIDRKTF